METKSHVEPWRWTSTELRAKTESTDLGPWIFLLAPPTRSWSWWSPSLNHLLTKIFSFLFLLGNMTQVIKSRCATNSPTFMTQFSFAFLFLMDTFGHPKSWCTFDILDFKPSITQTNLLYNKRIKLLDYFSTLNYMLGNIGKMYYACKIQLFCMYYFP